MGAFANLSHREPDATRRGPRMIALYGVSAPTGRREKKIGNRGLYLSSRARATWPSNVQSRGVLRTLIAFPINFPHNLQMVRQIRFMNECAFTLLWCQLSALRRIGKRSFHLA